MQIAIDTSPLSTGHINRGVGQYSKNLIEAVAKYESEHSYIYFDSTKDTIPHADIIHFPYFDPFFLTLPLYKPYKTVVTVHDLIPLVFPDKFKRGIRGEIKWQIQRYSLRGVHRVLTDSISSQGDIVTYAGFDKRKIDVVYLAPSGIYHSKKNSNEIRECKKTYNLPDRFMIYVGDINWNKNIPGLLQAFQKLSDQNNDMNLVLVGKSFLNKNLSEAKDIYTMIHSLGIEKNVKIVGYVPEDHLRNLYQLAVCSLTPSHYEGFGLPVLEAMSCGCPVICSANSSLNEIKGPSIIVDSHSVQSIVSAMMRMVLLTSSSRKKLVDSGLKWVNTFSWEKTAHQTIQAYKKAYEGSDI